MSARILAFFAVLLAGALLVGRLTQIGGAGRNASDMAPGAEEVISSATEIRAAPKAPIEDEATALSAVVPQPVASQREAQLHSPH